MKTNIKSKLLLTVALGALLPCYASAGTLQCPTPSSLTCTGSQCTATVGGVVLSGKCTGSQPTCEAKFLKFSTQQGVTCNKPQNGYTTKNCQIWCNYQNQEQTAFVSLTTLTSLVPFSSLSPKNSSSGWWIADYTGVCENSDPTVCKFNFNR